MLRTDLLTADRRWICARTGSKHDLLVDAKGIPPAVGQADLMPIGAPGFEASL
jgi:hypothetical protein